MRLQGLVCSHYLHKKTNVLVCSHPDADTTYGTCREQGHTRPDDPGA